MIIKLLQRFTFHQNYERFRNGGNNAREKKKGHWRIAPDKYLEKDQAQKLIKTMTLQAKQASLRGAKVAVRDCFVIDLGLSAGLRVMEIASLICSDLLFSGEASYIYVGKGKGNKSRLILIDTDFKNRCLQYISWKRSVGEPTGPKDPLVYSSNSKSHMSTRALQMIFKRAARKAMLPPHYSIHALRHTYATLLLVASNYNTVFAKEQLGHTSITTTETYLHVLKPEAHKAVMMFSLWRH